MRRVAAAVLPLPHTPRARSCLLPSTEGVCVNRQQQLFMGQIWFSGLQGCFEPNCQHEAAAAHLEGTFCMNGSNWGHPGLRFDPLAVRAVYVDVGDSETPETPKPIDAD